MIWIELRCGYRSEDNDDCYSHDNNDPGVPCNDNVKDIQRCYRELKEGAKDQGWKMINKEWHCPSCIQYLSNKS